MTEVVVNHQQVLDLVMTEVVAAWGLAWKLKGMTQAGLTDVRSFYTPLRLSQVPLIIFQLPSQVESWWGTPMPSGWDKNALVSCGAEGSIKVWDVSGAAEGHGVRRMKRKKRKKDPGATAVEVIKSDLKKVAVAFQNVVVKVFDVKTGREVSRLATDAAYDGTPATQVNHIVSHPTMLFLVTAHEDKFICIFNILSEQLIHVLLCHM
ncbi:hypothetical protein DFH29DRAFT_1043290 [Suillus ampliporus]|nr:hypothetical protein DFH29DRAFT_1043290 [Suillus ampliporus]